MESQIQIPKNFHSALDNYLQRLHTTYDPIVVQSQQEFYNMVCVSPKEKDVAAERSINVKTLILPLGVTLSDPRLKNAKVKSARVYDMKLGEYFVMPDHPFIADIHGDLVPPAIGPRNGEETRYQIVNASKLGECSGLMGQTAGERYPVQQKEGAYQLYAPPPQQF